MFAPLRWSSLVIPQLSPFPWPNNTVIAELLYYDTETSTWIPRKAHAKNMATKLPASSGLRIVTWNVAFHVEKAAERLKAALIYLRSHLGETASADSIILFQEVHPDALQSMLETDEWVQSTFMVTDSKLPLYSDRYGTVTLVGKGLADSVSYSSRTRYKDSFLGRDVLFVDLRCSLPLKFPEDQGEQTASSEEANEVTIRIGNTHLESIDNPRTSYRHKQLTQIKEGLTLAGIYAGIVSGDMNSDMASDFEVPNLLGFTDFWVLEHGEQESEDGATFGDQPPDQAGLRRLDKFFGVGDWKLGPDGVRIIGKGLLLHDSNAQGVDSEQNLWVSDHYALLGTFMFKSEE